MAARTTVENVMLKRVFSVLTGFLLVLVPASAQTGFRTRNSESSILSLMNSITGLELSSNEQLVLFMLLWFVFSGFTYVFVRQVVALIESGSFNPDPDDYSHKPALNVGLSLCIGAAGIIFIGNNLDILLVVSGASAAIYLFYKLVQTTGSINRTSFSGRNGVPEKTDRIKDELERIIEGKKERADRLAVHAEKAAEPGDGDDVADLLSNLDEIVNDIHRFESEGKQLEIECLCRIDEKINEGEVDILEIRRALEDISRKYKRAESYIRIRAEAAKGSVGKMEFDEDELEDWSGKSPDELKEDAKQAAEILRHDQEIEYSGTNAAALLNDIRQKMSHKLEVE